MSFLRCRNHKLTFANSQFGNVLVLIATLNSALSNLVKEEEVFSLLRRTIRFLRLYEDLSPLLEYDRSVLEHLQIRLLKDG